MNRDEIRNNTINIFENLFEFEDFRLDDDLRDVHGFDSIDAIELIREIEIMLGVRLNRAEKENAMDIRTIAQVIDYIEKLALERFDGAESVAP